MIRLSFKKLLVLYNKNRLEAVTDQSMSLGFGCAFRPTCGIGSLRQVRYQSNSIHHANGPPYLKPVAIHYRGHARNRCQPGVGIPLNEVTFRMITETIQ